MSDVATRRERLTRQAREWQVTLDEVRETESSLVAYGRRGSADVVLKMFNAASDERRSGEILAAFDGGAVVRVLEYAGDAVLQERLTPGTSLAEVAHGGADDEATSVLADVVARMTTRFLPAWCPTVEDWGKSFDRYLISERREIPRQLVHSAHAIYAEMCQSQVDRTLLHGDLHHHNVLFDTGRGWVAIDPKGVIGEVEYEIGALLRNPYERPELFARADRVERRLKLCADRLDIDVRRTLRWAFAQSVLAAIWGVEDGLDLNAQHPFLVLAEAIRPMLDAH
jgi:streptomycin 6-kinase